MTNGTRNYNIAAPFFLRHGVVAISAPGVAAENAPEGKQRAFEDTIFLDGGDGIFGAGGREAAGGGQVRRNARAIKPDWQECQKSDCHIILCINVFRAFRIAASIVS